MKIKKIDVMTDVTVLEMVWKENTLKSYTNG